MERKKRKAIIVRVSEKDKTKIEQDAKFQDRSVSNFLHWIWQVWHDRKEVDYDAPIRKNKT